MLDRLPLSDLRQLHAQLLDQLGSCDPDREPQFAGYLHHSAQWVTAEIDRRAGAIPSDRRRADNLRAVVASAHERLARIEMSITGTDPVDSVWIRTQLDLACEPLKMALADDDREREKLK